MTANVTKNKPQTTVVLAMSADGKITDFRRSPARFSSSADQAHLQKQVSLADGVLFGANTLRAYGTTMSVSNPQLLQQRQNLNKPPQPVQIVCSRSGQIEPEIRFFNQQIPRWLLTTIEGAKRWQTTENFERIITVEATATGINWVDAFSQLTALGIQKLAVLGGGELVASLLAEDLIDEFWLTICPIILGGSTTPTPVTGTGFLAQVAPKLKLISAEVVEQEIFLHYSLLPPP